MNYLLGIAAGTFLYWVYSELTAVRYRGVRILYQQLTIGGPVEWLADMHMPGDPVGVKTSIRTYTQYANKPMAYAAACQAIDAQLARGATP